MRREVEAPEENFGGGASAAARIRTAAEPGRTNAKCGARVAKVAADCSVEEKTAGAAAGSTGRLWQQETCERMVMPQSAAMARQQAWPVGATGRMQASAGTAVTKTTRANRTAAPFLLQLIGLL
jgi:hypothetical protein